MTPISNSVSFEDMTDSQKMLVMSLALNDINNKVSEHDKLLITGNGGLPIPERIRNIENFVSTFRYWSKFLVGALIIQTVAFFFGVVVAIVRFLPVLERLAAQP